MQNAVISCDWARETLVRATYTAMKYEEMYTQLHFNIQTMEETVFAQSNKSIYGNHYGNQPTNSTKYGLHAICESRKKATNYIHPHICSGNPAVTRRWLLFDSPDHILVKFPKRDPTQTAASNFPMFKKNQTRQQSSKDLSVRSNTRNQVVPVRPGRIFRQYGTIFW